MSAFFDACFVSQAYRVSKYCDILEWISSFVSDGCYTFKDQYDVSTCNAVTNCCEDIDDQVDDEDVVLFFYDEPEGVSLEKIMVYNFDTHSGDFFDVRAAYAAYKNNYEVYTCDKKLLQLCKDLKLTHKCFKKAVYDLHCKIDDDLYALKGFEFGFMLDKNQDNPFLGYYKSAHCAKCNGAPCDFTPLIGTSN